MKNVKIKVIDWNHGLVGLETQSNEEDNSGRVDIRIEGLDNKHLTMIMQIVDMLSNKKLTSNIFKQLIVYCWCNINNELKRKSS